VDPFCVTGATWREGCGIFQSKRVGLNVVFATTYLVGSVSGWVLVLFRYLAWMTSLPERLQSLLPRGKGCLVVSMSFGRFLLFCFFQRVPLPGLMAGPLSRQVQVLKTGPFVDGFRSSRRWSCFPPTSSGRRADVSHTY